MFNPISIPFGCVMLFNVVDLKDGVTVSDVELALGEMCNVVKNTYGNDEGGFIVGQVFKYDGFQYVRHELKDLTINISNSSDVAWWYCVLDDINTWNGQPANWENARWTGVLEKREGSWIIVQQHFSFAS